MNLLGACEKTVASDARARRTARSDETYQIDRREASTAQRSYRGAQQVYSQALRRYVLALALSTTSLGAEEGQIPGGLEVLPDAVPPVPARVQSGEPLEQSGVTTRPSEGALEGSQVTIRQRAEEVIEEYRINGNLYMVKVTPIIGPAYYFLDQDGDGTMETNMSEIYSNFIVPQWVLFSW